MSTALQLVRKLPAPYTCPMSLPFDFSLLLCASSTQDEDLLEFFADYRHMTLSITGEVAIYDVVDQSHEVVVIRSSKAESADDGPAARLIRYIRSKLGDQLAYILVVTDDTDPVGECTFLHNGANDVVVAPFAPQVLTARLAVAFRHVLMVRYTSQAHAFLDGEMQLISRLQQKLFQRQNPRLPGVRIAHFYQPSEYASGDYYDYFVTGDKLRVIVADVSGHGVKAAYYMAMVYSLFNATATRHMPLAETIGLINTQIAKVNTSKADFVTIFAADIDRRQRVVEYVSAGHCPGLLVDDEQVREVRQLGPAYPPAGLFEMTYAPTRVEFAWPARLLLFTDGFYEFDAGEEQGQEGVFGLDEFVEMAGAMLRQGFVYPEELLKRIDDLCGMRPLYKDDLTALVVELTDPD